MSNQTNDVLLDKAKELADILTNHPGGIDTALEQAAKTKDWDKLEMLIIEGDALIKELDEIREAEWDKLQDVAMDEADTMAREAGLEHDDVF
jgi:hypothetical protein